MKRIIVVAGLIAFSHAASAHTGLLPTGGFSHGFQHPFLGLDHFLAMLGLGLWASSQSRRLAKQALGVFLLFMTAGALLGLTGFGFAYVETAILVSLLLVGVTLSVNTVALSSVKPSPEGEGWVRGNQHRKKSYLYPPHPSLLPQGEGVHVLKSKVLMHSFGTARLPKGIILTLIALIASMHGLAHGSEMPVAASAYAYVAGIVLGTAVLHFSGLALGLIARRVNAIGLIRVYGTLTGLVGAWLLFAA